MNNQDGAAKFLRHLGYQLASDELEPSSEVARLREIADDLDFILEAVAKSGEGPLFEAVQRLRNGGAQ